MKADLHVHTTFSDGVWTPLEVAQAAAAQGYFAAFLLYRDWGPAAADIMAFA